MILKTYTKQPLEIKDYDIDYAPWLLPMSDTLDAVDVTIVCIDDPTDTTLVCDEVLHTTVVAKFWVRGGTAGRRYKLTANASTVGGRVDESELVFAVRDY